MMKMKTLFAAALLSISGTAQAHEIWIERDGEGPARIYLGEPEGALPPGGDPEFPKLKAPTLLGASATPVRKAGYLEVIAPAGDVRAWDDNIFAPWGEEGAREGVIYYARAGRSETRAELPFEIVPVTAGGNHFRLVRDGRPVADTAITVITPDKWTRKIVTDADGTIELTPREAGRYLLSAAVEEKGSHTLPGGDVQTLHQITTTTFMHN